MNEFHKSITCVYIAIAILAMTQGTHKHTQEIQMYGYEVAAYTQGLIITYTLCI